MRTITKSVGRLRNILLRIIVLYESIDDKALLDTDAYDCTYGCMIWDGMAIYHVRPRIPTESVDRSDDVASYIETVFVPYSSSLDLT